MKRIFGLIVLMIAITGCQKAPDSARINSTRNQGLPPGATSTPSGITLNGLVTADASYQDQFEQEVKDFMEGSVDPDLVGTVSDQGLDQTGVFVGGKVELASGQPLTSVANGVQSITSNSQLLIAVFDKFQDQPNLTPLSPIYLTQSTGTISGNNVDLTFGDKYGTVHLVGTFDQNMVVLKFSFDTTLKYDGSGPGYAGDLGGLRIPTCSFFRCK